MDQSFQVLSEQDYLNIIEIIHELGNCEKMDDLQRLAETTLLPLLKAQTFGAAWIDFDLKGIKQGEARLFVTAGLPDHEREIAEKLQTYCQSVTEIFVSSLRPAVTHDIDVPRNCLTEEIERFFSDHPDLNKSDYPIASNVGNFIALADSPDFSIGIGFSRIKPHDAPFTYRELRMAELLQPSLVHSLKYIALRRDLTHIGALAEHLADTPNPIALVCPEGGIRFCNPVFEETFHLQAGNPLPDDLALMVQTQDDVFSPTENFLGQDHQPLFFRWENEIYRLNLTRLDPMEDYEGRCWLLKFKPALEPQSKVAYAMHRGQLTPRETEVASLVCDGFTDKQIAQRLFISPSTVNNHLKSIFKKMEVHNRVLLAHRLQGIMKGV